MEQRTNSTDEIDSCDRILPLLSESGDRRLVTEWIDEHPAYESVDLTGSIEDTAFDVCILDTGAFREHLPALRAKKSAVSPVVLPYLLLLDESDPEIIDIDGGDLAENVVTESIDEIVTMPIEQAELHWRLSALLRLREQSLTLRQRERDLERQVDFFEKAQDIADVGAWEYDIQTDDLIWTKEVYKIYNLSEDCELAPETAIEHYHPDDRDTIQEAFWGAVEESESYDVELRLITAEGDQRWVRTHGEPQQEDGDIVRVRGTIQDITDRKERERELQRVKQAVEASEHAIFITDPDGTITYANPAFEALTGFSQEDTIGETPAILDSGETSEEYWEWFWEVILSGETWEREIINRRKNGETYAAHQTVAPVTDDGDIEAFVAVQTDITERKQREQRLQRQSRAIAEAPAGIVITDPDREDNPMIYVNDAFVEMTGYPREECLGENCRFLQGENTDSERVKQIREAIDNEEPISIKLRNYRKNSTEFWNHLKIAPVRNDQGEVVNYIGFQQDVTDLEERTRQLEVLDNILRHNIRNNLNVIYGRGEQIKSVVDGELQNAADLIIAQAEDLLTTSEKSRAVTDVLTESVVSEPIDIEELVRSVAQQVTAEFPETDIAVKGSLEVGVVGIPSLYSALEELFTNAVIHNDSEEPRLHVELSAGEKYATLIIQDNGPGISTFDKNVLETGDAIDELSHGSGLGLWLVYWAIKRSGGDISVDYESEGTKITVRLPLATDS